MILYTIFERMINEMDDIHVILIYRKKSFSVHLFKLLFENMKKSSCKLLLLSSNDENTVEEYDEMCQIKMYIDSDKDSKLKEKILSYYNNPPHIVLDYDSFNLDSISLKERELIKWRGKDQLFYYSRKMLEQSFGNDVYFIEYK